MGAPMTSHIKPEPDRNPGTILVLRKTVALLRAFSHEQPELSLPELRGLTGLPTTTCQRIVANLVAEQVLERSGDRLRIGRSVLEWAAVAKQGTPLHRTLRGILHDLRDETGETACAFTPEGRFRVCIEVVPTMLPVRPQTYVGQTVPLNIGAAGKVLLAFDDELLAATQHEELEKVTEKSITDHDQLDIEVKKIRKAGYSISSEEGRSGLAGVAVPVFEADGAVVASIALSVPLQRGSRQRLRSLVPFVAAAGKRASDRLGYHAGISSSP